MVSVQHVEKEKENKMTNKLKQIERLIVDNEKGARLSREDPDLSGLYEIETLLVEALTLLKDVESGDAHVMRWVEGEIMESIKNIKGGNKLHFDGRDMTACEYEFEGNYTHHATFNGSPVIPTPTKKGG